MALKLIARERGFVNKFPGKIEDAKVVSWLPGEVTAGETFDWHWSFDVEGYDEETRLALLPLWCDAADPVLQEKLVDLRSDPDKVQEIRRRVSKHQAGRTRGGFDPYRRHATLDQGRQRAKLDAERESKAPAKPAEMADGIHESGAGWYTIKVGDAMERVRGREAAEDKLAEMQGGEVRAADASV